MTKSTHKPRICFALPGIQYTPHSPYIRSTLPMIPYLEQDFDITMVYRKILQTGTDHINHKYLTIVDEANASEHEKKNQSSYFVPNHYASLWKYRQQINTFAHKHHEQFDLVFEKEWPLLGAFVSSFFRYEIPTVILIEAMYKYRKSMSLNPVKQIAGVGLKKAQPFLRKRWCDWVDSIVVETQEMKSVLLDTGYVEASKPIYPIPYGVDPDIFAVRDRTYCRAELGIAADQFVLTYVGSLNRFIQEPGAIIEALGREQPQNVVLYMVGDGAKQGELEDLARQFNAPVRFVGRLPQKDAAMYIGAANLCIAPYNKDLYFGEKFTCASLKVPEYMSCGRAVLTIPCERMEMLTDQQNYGFLVPNQVEPYREFFRNLPTLNRLAEIEVQIVKDMDRGILRDKRILLRWWDIADMYKEVIEQAIATSPREMALAF